MGGCLSHKYGGATVGKAVVPENPFSLLGYAIAALTILVSWLTNRRKSDVDESALVLAKWKELVEQHERTLATLNSDINSLRLRLDTAERTISELQEQSRKERARIAELEEENKGLKANFRQTSQSSLRVLSRAAARADASDQRQTVAETRADGVDTRQTSFDERQNVNDERVLGIEAEVSKQSGEGQKP